MSIYVDLEEDFKKALQTNSLGEFIRVLENRKKQSPYDIFFLGLAYDYSEDDAKAYEYYIRALFLIKSTDGNIKTILKHIKKFINKTGYTDIYQLMVKWGFPTPKNSRKPSEQTDSNNTPTQQPNVNEMSPQQALNEGKRAFNNKDFSYALKLLEYVYNSSFQNPDSIFMLAQTLQRLHQYPKAIFYLNKGVKLYNRDEHALILFINLKAQIYYSQKQWNDAIKAYEELLRLLPKERSGYRQFIFTQLIGIYRKIGQPKQAELVQIRLLNESNPNSKEPPVYTKPPLDPFSYIESDISPSEGKTSQAYQNLLYIMSMYGKGTWQSFRGFCKVIGLDPKQIMRHLRLLGHVELINHGRDWVVAPPCLVQPDINPNSQSGYTVFLAGQRSKSIVDFLSYYAHTIEPHPYKNAPECIYIHFNNQEDAQEFASRHHYHQVGTVARTMVEQLPTLDEWESLLPSQLIVTAHYNFSEWRDGVFTPLEGLPNKTGLYEVKHRNSLSNIPKQTLYYDAGREQWLKTDWYGLRYLMLKRTGKNPKIHYNPQENLVIIDKNHILPYIYEKALVLASGCLPTDRGDFISYSGVSRETIHLLSSKIEAELVEHKGGE